MAKVRKVDYFKMMVRNRAGEGARLLKDLKKNDVGLLAFSAFPEGGGAQIDFVPEDSAQFLKVCRQLDWKVGPRKTAFLLQGKDRTGALASVLGKLGKAGINVIALDAATAGKRRFGALFWVSPAEVAKAARLLGAR